MGPIMIGDAVIACTYLLYQDLETLLVNRDLFFIGPQRSEDDQGEAD